MMADDQRSDINDWLGNSQRNAESEEVGQAEQQDTLQTSMILNSQGENVDSAPVILFADAAISKSTDPKHSDNSSSRFARSPAQSLSINIRPLSNSLSNSASSSVTTKNSTETQENLLIRVPVLNDQRAAKYTFLPGHFEVTKILFSLPEHEYIVALRSGEIAKCYKSELITHYTGGKPALTTFDKMKTRSRDNLPPRTESGHVDWNNVQIEDEPAHKKRKTTDPTLSKSESSKSDGNFSDADSAIEVRKSRRTSLRSRRKVPAAEQVPQKPQEQVERTISLRSRHNQDQESFYELPQDYSEDEVLRPRARPQRISKRNSGNNLSSTSRTRTSTPDVVEVRRSGRTRVQRDMVEKQEDDLVSQSEEEKRSNVVAAKEIFTNVAVQDPFRQRHQQQCSSCGSENETSKGPLVFCQGCTDSYHEKCLGSRGTRHHLVTKVGDALFVLQCKRCIGFARDSAAPHLGRCEGCGDKGTCSDPFTDRLSGRQEQTRREQNGGIDPITVVQAGTINCPNNVLFRCRQCHRAWHFPHLPEQPDSSEEPSSTNILRSLDHYSQTWTCNDCSQSNGQVDAVVAWRPLNQDTYQASITLQQLKEHEKEYLVKWQDMSYFHCIWMPGTWVYCTCPLTTRKKFARQSENNMPRASEQDAIPEEYLRVDIVFDVRYKGELQATSTDEKCAGIDEVESAYVKYKGLGYEDAVWELPPDRVETERFQDFKEAYEDYVRKKEMAVPSTTTLSRIIAQVRESDFETDVIRKAQPAMMTGGKIMQYQLEGLNWLYYQWYRQHNAILADEMGLGKTIQLVALMTTLVEEHDCWPFLVVVPNSTCPNWRREIKKWSPGLRAVCYYGSSTARKLTHDYELFPTHNGGKGNIKAHIVIVSYESIIDSNVISSLAKVQWQGLIVDEGQRLKNDENLIYNKLMDLTFPFKVLMTGTPLQNNARELFNLLQFLDKDQHDAAKLAEKYAELTQDKVHELHDMLKPYFLRRTKAQVLTFLPPMSQIIVPVTMSELQRKVSKSIMSQNASLMKSLFSRDKASTIKDRTNLNNILMQLRKTLCHPYVYSRDIEDCSLEPKASFNTLVEASAKLQLLSIMLPKLKDRGHRVLLFSQFLDNLDIVEDFLDGLGMLHRRLDGSITALEKQKRIDAFNAPDSPYFAFLLSTRAGGVGINLATADTVIILDPDFNPHQDIQALSRAHRIGQQSKVLVFQLMTRNSAEEKIMQIGKKKMALDHVLIEAMDHNEEAGVDLESILRHGASALFEDEDAANNIVYNDTSVDRLLDRSRVEATRTDASQSAQSQFSIARIWQQEESDLRDDIAIDDTATPNHGVWEAILKERQAMFDKEELQKAEQLGRGKRKRGTIDYTGKAGIADVDDSPVKNGKVDDSDGNFEFDETKEANESADDTDPEPSDHLRIERTECLIPASGDTQSNQTVGQSPSKRCGLCQGGHPAGWCLTNQPASQAAHCNLCGTVHRRVDGACPILNDKKEVELLLKTLRESTESKEFVAAAKNHLEQQLKKLRHEEARKKAPETESAGNRQIDSAVA